MEVTIGSQRKDKSEKEKKEILTKENMEQRKNKFDYKMNFFVWKATC